MIAYGIIMIITGMAILVMSILLFLGYVNLLHDYHRNNVKKEDEKKLGKSSGLSLSLSAFGAILSGIFALIWQEDIRFIFLFLIFIGPFFISTILLIIFIKKYNGKFIS